MAAPSDAQLDGRPTESAREVELSLLTDVVALEERIGSLHRKITDLFRPDASADRGPAPPVRPTQRATELYATFLGTFTVARAGVLLDLGRSRPTLEACRYLLAHTGRRVPRDELLELLWPDANPSVTTHRLHVAVSSLRRVLDGRQTRKSCISFEEDCYFVDPHAVRTDCELFEQQYSLGMAHAAHNDLAGAAAALRSALDLYRGDYLADFPYADWPQQRRAHFVERRLSALTFLSAFALQEGDMAGLLDLAQQVLEIDPLREMAHRHMMRAQYNLGQRACAMRQYTACAELLQRELGVLPSSQTRALYEAVHDEASLPPEPLFRP